MSYLEPNSFEPIVIDDPSPKHVEVTISGKRYHLLEATVDAATRYRNLAIKSARMTDGKITGVEGIADAEPNLISNCLFELNAEGKRVGTVSERIIRGWANHIQKLLFDRIKSISDGLVDKPSAKELKKQIKQLQDQLKDLEEDREPGKSEPSSTSVS